MYGKVSNLFDNLIEFASGRKTIEVSGLHNLEENS